MEPARDSSPGYRERFSAASESPEPALELVAQAIVAFVRTLRSVVSPASGRAVALCPRLARFR